MLVRAFRIATTAVAAAVLFVAATPAGAAPRDPAAFARELYALPNLWADVTADDEAREKYLAPSLAALVAANDAVAEEVNRLDYDPLTDSQDFEITDLRFSVIESSESKASVQVDFRNFGEAVSLTLELEANGDAWRLANIRYDAERSLSDDLEFMNEAE
jgi:hypothetical protein